uniref:Uncharacterized protein n=1 Tax=Arundo donax TaxID=35708 RepID=A0A0A9CZU7_ARUDO
MLPPPSSAATTPRATAAFPVNTAIKGVSTPLFCLLPSTPPKVQIRSSPIAPCSHFNHLHLAYLWLLAFLPMFHSVLC